MPLIPHVRASALPAGAQPLLPPSALRRLEVHAAERPDAPAFVIGDGDAAGTRTWGEVARTVELAAAGLIRSGMRADQVVLSLLPSAHDRPELDLALQAIGTVVVHVDPRAAGEDIAGALDGVDVRLVLAAREQELDRLAGLQFRSAEMFEVGGAGWDRLLALGAERLRMDPAAVSRVDHSVDPAGVVARVIGRDGPMGRVGDAGAGVLDLVADAVTVVVGGSADPFVHQVRQAHLVSGGTLAHVASVRDLAAVLADVRPTVLGLDPEASSHLADVAPAVPGARRLRSRPRKPDLEAQREWFGGRLATVVAAGLPEAVRQRLVALGIDVVEAPHGGLLPADLPAPPQVVVGDAADLPRRSRQDPGRDFQLENDRAPLIDEREESAFVLPSLPLFGGESFLDKLLLARAREARA